MEDFKEEYRGFIIIRHDDDYVVFHMLDVCGIYTTYSQACDAVDKFYKYFGGAANVTL